MELLTRWQLPVRLQIIVPFFVLLVFVAIVGTGALTYEATGAGLASLDQNLLRASGQVNDNLATLEAGRVNDLRAIAATPGLARAVAAADEPRLSELFAAKTATARDAHVVIRILDSQGKAVLSIPQNNSRPAFARMTAIRLALSGSNDARGDTYLAVVPETAGQIVYWAAPIREANRQVIGAVLIGESITHIAAQIRPSDSGGLFFYALTGQPLEPSATASLGPDVRRSVTPDHLMRVSARAGGHAYAVAVAEWTIRGERLGYLGVGLPADGIVNNVLRLRIVLLLAFVGTALLVLVVGGLLARRITQPLEGLVRSMRMVAAGDLSHRAAAGPANEIGYLASSFNEMTASLEEKTKALEATSFASIEALARAIDARDPYTYGHSARVARLSFEIADELGLPPEQLMALSRAALLHDIGKIGVEDRVLRKPGPLDTWEMEAMREHPVIGYKMLRGLDFLKSSLTGVRHHHEHWDGTGYPDGLEGNDIPLAVRILTVADALDALTSDRPYRRALSFSAAMSAVEAGAGKQFDPAVIRALRSRSVAIAVLTLMSKPRAKPLEVLEEPAI